MSGAAAGERSARVIAAWMALDWLTREHAPAFLRLAGLDAAAEELASMPCLLALDNPGALDIVEAPLTAAHREACRAGEQDPSPRSAWAIADGAGACEAWAAISRDLPPQAVHLAHLARGTAGHAASAARAGGALLTSVVPDLRASLERVLGLSPAWIPAPPAACEIVSPARELPA